MTQGYIYSALVPTVALAHGRLGRLSYFVKLKYHGIRSLGACVVYNSQSED